MNNFRLPISLKQILLSHILQLKICITLMPNFLYGFPYHTITALSNSKFSAEQINLPRGTTELCIHL